MRGDTWPRWAVLALRAGRSLAWAEEHEAAAADYARQAEDTSGGPAWGPSLVPVYLDGAARNAGEAAHWRAAAASLRERARSDYAGRASLARSLSRSPGGDR